MGMQKEEIRQLMERYREYRSRGLLWNIIVFGQVLRELGLQITVGRLLDAVRSLTVIDLKERRDFYYALQTNLVSSPSELTLFRQAFDLFWTEWGEGETPEERISRPGRSRDDGGSETLTRRMGREILEGGERGDDGGRVEGTHSSYSPYEVLRKKDFSQYSPLDNQEFQRLLVHLLPKLATRLSRRRYPHPKGTELDFRKTLRRNMRYGGELLRLIPKRRRIKKSRLVLLCDVSGSMDCYSRFLIQFMYGLQNLLPQLDTFVFSTRLTRIGHLLKGRDMEEALARVAELVLDWSGGTTIGKCLKAFNEWFRRDSAAPRTIVIIISDGWDRGDTELLAHEMKRLRQRAHKLIWLNPLLGSPSYQPLCKGMQAALPYVDYFLPAHNLESLLHLCKRLREMIP